LIISHDEPSGDGEMMVDGCALGGSGREKKTNKVRKIVEVCSIRQELRQY
jgi:hypothetical protein